MGEQEKQPSSHKEELDQDVLFGRIASQAYHPILKILPKNSDAKIKTQD